MLMKKVSLKSPVPMDKKTRDIKLYWNLSTAIRQNKIPKDRVEKQINFILANSKQNNPKMESKFLELRQLNRKR